MNAMILDQLPGEVDKLGVRAAMGEDVEAELATLVAQAREMAGTDAEWKHRVEDVRGALKMRNDQHGFYADAIARLTALIEGP